MPPTDHDAVRKQYLAAIEQEIDSAQSRLADADARLDSDAPDRVRATVAIANVTLDWLIAERDRLRAGGTFDEEAARRLLLALQEPD
jgi:hypothetical protein